jgi:hypothetical protein
MRVCGTKSVWTVDLAYVLSRYGVDFTFCTVTDGVRPEYDSEVRLSVHCLRHTAGSSTEWLAIITGRGHQAFYKADIDADMVRVNRLFQSADSLNICIQKRFVCRSRHAPARHCPRPLTMGLLAWQIC